MKKINFCQNWNKKLDGNIYTTIQRHNNYYVQDEDYEITLNRIFLHNSCIDILSTFPLRSVPKATIMLDTGYSYDESIEIFRRLNKFKTIDEVLKALFDVMLLVKIKNNSKINE